VREADLFLCIDLDAGRRGELAEAWVRLASEVRREWLPEAHLSEDTEVEYDPERDRVVALRRSRYLDLVLEEREAPATPEEATDALAAFASADPQSALDLSRPEVATFLARLRCLAAWRPDLELPTFGTGELRQLLPTLCAGKRSLAELRRAPLLEVLQGTLSYPQRQALEREAPERLEVPSGSHIRLQYREGEPPVLAARIQELFGLLETPRVAGGRVPVLLHLLAPNMRPQQVTQDLESFWRTTYPEVRKELLGRYPKHSWPEDPWRAEAVRGVRRRR
jgi:ATP-dependent helicase HrpB